MTEDFGEAGMVSRKFAAVGGLGAFLVGWVCGVASAGIVFALMEIARRLL
jgi:hypothetical protein